MVVRQARPAEPLIQQEFSGLVVDPAWGWIVEHNGEAKGLLLAAPCHGMAFLLRLVVLPDSPPHTAFRLLRGAFADLKARGVLGFMTLLEGNETETKLARLCARLGATFVSVHGVVAAGRI